MASCDFVEQLTRLVQPSCMVRTAAGPGSPHTQIEDAAFYGLNARRLPRRRQHLLEQLRLAGATDVTLVHCADSDDVRALTPATRDCLHPYTVATPWTRPDTGEMGWGTVSLALKHMIAMHDMLARRLPRAVVLEDDAFLVSNFKAELRSLLLHVPSDAYILHLGSYRRCLHRFGHADGLALPLVASGSNAKGARRPADDRTHATCYDCVHRRDNQSGVVGTIGQVYYARGAKLLLRPVIAPSDVLFSMQRAPVLAPSPTCVERSPHPGGACC